MLIIPAVAKKPSLAAAARGKVRAILGGRRAAVGASDSALIQDQIAVFKALEGGWRSGD
jgi:hypothetical protein